MKLLIKLLRFSCKSALFFLRVIITVLLSDNLYKSIEEDREEDKEYNYHYYNNKNSGLDQY